jgi:glycosyltransferase involved in cell wall biosynthesis
MTGTPQKILLDARGTQTGFKDHKHRGIGHYAFQLLRTIIPMLQEFETILLAERETPLDPPLDACGSRVFGIPSSSRLLKAAKFLGQHYAVSRGLSTLRPDLAHFLAHGDATIMTRTPYVVTLHDTVSASASSLYDWKQRMKHRIMQQVDTRVVEHAAAILTDSEHSRQDIVHHYQIDPQKVTVTHLGADERFHEEITPGQIADVRNRLQLPDLFLLYVGGIDPRKNIPTMLKALQLLRMEHHTEIPLLMAGRIRGQREYPVIQELISTFGLQSTVHELGFVPDADLPVLMRASSALLFISLYEGFGLPVVQAMAAGTPVITSPVSSIPEVAGDCALYVDPRDPAAVAQGIHNLLTDSNRAAAMVTEGRERSKLFTWEQTAARTVAVYREILRNR